jgi:diguanylate cyclase (GGDEF)-like protein/PAS domain S-box-containing protein
LRQDFSAFTRSADKNMPREPSQPALLAAAVDTARMRECYRVAPQSILAMVGAAFLAAALLSREGELLLVWGWFGLVIADACLRLAVLRHVSRQLVNPALTLPNENLYALVAMSTGLAWASIILGCVPHSASLQMMMVLLVVAIGYTSIITIGISAKTYFAVVAPTISAEIYVLLQRTRISEDVPWPVLLLLPIGLMTALAMYRRSVMPGILQQQELHLLTRELQAMFDNTLVGIAHVRNQHFVTVNAECAHIYGFAPEQLNGKFIGTVFDSTQDGDLIMAQTAAALRLRGEAVYEARYTRPDGQTRHLLSQGHRFDREDPSKGTVWVLMDMTARKEAELALAASEDAYRRLVETVPSIIFSLDMETRFSFVNDAGVRQIAGLPAGDVLGRRFTDFILPQEKENSLAKVRRVISGETLVGMESRVLHRDGRVVTLSVTAQPLRDPGGRIVGISGTAVDVTERKKRESELQRTRDLLHSAIEAMSDGFILFDRDDRIALCNRRYAELYGTGQRPDELVGKHFSELQLFANQRREQIPPEFLGDGEAWARERLRRHREASGQSHMYETGDDRWIQVTKRRTSDGSVVGIYTDITQMKRTEEAVRILAQHDALTGLPNRRLMSDRLAQAIAQAKRNQELVGLLLIDLDNFKPINDEHGHRAGDEVLRIVALRLKECVREVDTVARYGGDEFIIVLSAVNRPRDAGLVAEKVIAALSEPIPALWTSQHGRRSADVRIGCSVGISMYPQDAAQPDALIRCADAAMYVAKSRGRGCLVFHAAAPKVPPK